ncbi:MAG: proline iminopeptidase-family hydrolase [Bdellovibrionota bacterium]
MSYIQTKETKVFYERQVVKGSTPLLLLHGGPGGDSRNLRKLFDLFPDRTLYTYDQGGGGRSGKILPNKRNIVYFVQELKELIALWKLDRFHLFGGSWGTTLALEYYLRVKNNGVQSLLFSSPMFSAPLWEQDAHRLIKKLPNKTRKIIQYCHEIGATDAKVYQEAMQVFYLKHVLRDRKKLLAMMHEKAKNNPQGREIYQYMWGASEFSPTGTLKKYDRTRDLYKISVPTFFSCGHYDEATPKTVKFFHQKVKGSQFQVIANASHVSNVERPREFVKGIQTFLHGIEA